MKTVVVLLLPMLLAAHHAPAGGNWSTLKHTGAIDVYRDDAGIPHIFAKSVEDAFWAEGYLEAQDRLWQMETLRRAAKGESAELLGPKAADQDVDRRRRGYTEAELQAMFDERSERMKSIVNAYCTGVNAFIKEGKLPAKYAELKATPREWTPTDCVAIGVLMSRRFGDGGDVELQVSALYEQLKTAHGEEKASVMLHDLLPDSDPLAPTTLNDQLEKLEKDEKHNYLPPAQGMSAEAFALYQAELDAIMASREFVGVPIYFGSNAWVIAPKKSWTGRAMLYGGPMMGHGSPSICNQLHLVAPGLDVGGMSFPGVPGVMIGFNQALSFTTTSGGADLIDVYALELNPENDAEYRWNGEWKKFESIDVEVKVAGGESRKETVLRSRYGPLTGPVDAKNHRAYTLCMSFWKKEALTFEAVMDFNFAANVQEMAKSVPKVATSHNWFAADADGHIAFWYAGFHPKRKAGHDPRLPMKGDGTMDWEGLLPFGKWPQSVDPANGFFTNWNNKPARDWEPTGWGKVFWGQRLADVITAKEKITFEEVQALAREVAYRDFLADHFMPYILEGADEKTAALLKAYDRVKRDGAAEPAIVEKWVERMMLKIFADELGPLAGTKALRQYLASPLLYVLEGGGRLKHDWLGKDRVELSKKAMEEALKAAAWKEGEVDFWGKKIKSERGRGTFQMAVEMSKEGPRAVTLSAPGQSEDPASAHGGDQAELFKEWKYREFVVRREKMR